VASPPASRALPFRLVLITDWLLGEELLLARVQDALRAGPGIAVQHRHPEATTRRFFEEGQRLAALCRRFAAPLFVNGRLDVALALDAHLHLPSRGLRVDEARPHLPAGRWVSAAVHDGDEARAALGADLALVSPLFPSGSKQHDGRPRLAAAGFHRLQELVACPAFALGGVRPEHVDALRPVPGVAVISAVLQAPSPRAAAAEFLGRLAGTLPSPPRAGTH
jgi:thiamine-phosphate pyrophosphorylase